MFFDFKYALQIIYFASSAMNSVVVCYVNSSIALGPLILESFQIV